MKTSIEHVNITVGDANRSADLLSKLFGWHVRWSGPAMHGGKVVHVGCEDHYLALYEPPEAGGQPFAWEKGNPLNHVAIMVDDLDALEERAVALGLQPFGHGDYEPGRRFYFFDGDGIEFEVVSYSPVEEARAAA
jgi:catechol 2,3-dioxygenase-like lactoylglutathione lyase family enzyme